MNSLVVNSQLRLRDNTQGHNHPFTASVTADVTFQLVTAVIKMALRPGSGGGSRYFSLLKSTVSGKCHSFV